jgi:tetratricopeptide (TPR) repeat protein
MGFSSSGAPLSSLSEPASSSPAAEPSPATPASSSDNLPSSPGTPEPAAAAPVSSPEAAAAQPAAAEPDPPAAPAAETDAPEPPIDISPEAERGYREAKAWDKLIELLVARVEHTEEAPAREQLLQQVARIYEDELSAPDKAFAALQVAFESDRTGEVTNMELERLADLTHSWNALLMSYSRVIETITDPAVRVRLFVKMGGWYAEKLGHPDYAVASFQQALTVDPANHPALDGLAQLNEKSGRWPELVAVRARQLELTAEPAEKVRILLGIGRLWDERLGDRERATHAFRAAYEVDAYNLEVLEALERLARVQGRWSELIDLLIRKIEALGPNGDREQVVELRSEIGDLCEHRLGDPVRAIGAYALVLELEPQNLQVLRALEKLYQATGRNEELIRTLETLIELVPDDEKVGRYQRLATLWEELSAKPDKAAECLEKLLAIDPTHEPAFRSLERIYRHERKFEDLVHTLHAHVFALTSVPQIVDLNTQIGQVCEKELRDENQAIEAYKKVLELIPDDRNALEALGRLYRRIGESELAASALRKLVELTADRTDKTELHHRLGRIYQAELGRSDEAESQYRSALLLTEGHMASAVALTSIYRERADWPRTVQMLERQAAHTSAAAEKAELLYEAARIHESDLGDELKASERYAQALEAHPEHVNAAEALVEIYFRDERWDALEPILDMLLRKSGKKEAGELLKLRWRMAYACEKLGKDDKALKHYRQAHELDATYLPTLTGMATLLYRREEWDQAAKIYEDLIEHHREAHSRDQVVEMHYRIAGIKLRAGERAQALQSYARGLEQNPHHKPTLLAVIDLHEKGNDWAQVVDTKHQLLEATESDDERFALLERIGDHYKDKLKEGAKAIQEYCQALEIKPRSRNVLQKLLDQYGATEQWKNAVDMALRVAELDDNAKIKAKYFYFAGATYREMLQSPDDSVEYFNRALDADVAGQVKAFDSIEKILTEKSDWKALERNYRRMVKRVLTEGDPTLRPTLLHKLGELYAGPLGDMKAATEAYALASSLEPDNHQRHEILARLYTQQGGDQTSKAVKEHQYLLRRAPDRIESYKSLAKLYLSSQQHDKAWCLCSTLAFLKSADGAQLRFLEQYKPKDLVRVRQKLNAEMWSKNVQHPDEEPSISGILASAAEAVRQLSAQPLKVWNLKTKDKRELASTPPTFARNYQYAAHVLDSAPIDLYVPDGAPPPGGMGLINTQGSLTLLAGADVLRAQNERGLVFMLARQLSSARPDHLLRTLLVPAGGLATLRTVLTAVLRLVSPQIPVEGDAQEIDRVSRHLANPKVLPPPQQEVMVGHAHRLMASKGGRDLARWVAASDLTSARAGLLLCDDLDLAVKLTIAEPRPAGSPPPKEMVADLVLYSASEEYFAARRHLGLALG